jgi:glycosyltransferase involved in cell wall biosynthesis
MRVLMVNDLPVGPGSGAEVHVGRLAEALERAGDRVEVFTGGTRHHGVGKALDVWDPWVRRSLATAADRFRPDVVHHHNVLRELSVSVLGVPRAAAQVMTLHDHRLVRADEGPEGEGRGLVHQAKVAKAVLDRTVARRRVDVLVAVSAELGEKVARAGFPRVRVIPGFADGDAFADEPPGDDVVFAGRLSAEKGIDVLVHAFASIAAAHPATRVLIAGEGPERARLERLAVSRHVDAVIFLGLLDADGVRDLLRRARVVCSTSTRVTEGAPLVVIEAMLAGRPVIGTDSPAFRELLGTDGERGVVVPRDDPGALAAELAKLLDEPARAAAIGAAARDHALARYTPEVAVAAHQAAYHEAIRAHGR